MHDDDRMVGRLLTRRELVALFGTTGVVAIARPAGARVFLQQPGAGAAGCVVQPQQTEGPYFIDEKLNRSDIRAEPGTGAIKEGAPLELTFNVSRVDDGGACVPLPGAQVDLWHCDAMGVYSGVRDQLFDTQGQKFLRGYQVSDASGATRFVTIYPGWYPGRAVHIHFKVRTNPTAARGDEFTSQLYFDEQMTDRVYASAPYAAHTGARTSNDRDGIYGSGGSQLMLPVVQKGDRYVASFSLAMRPGASAPAGRGRGIRLSAPRQVSGR